MLRGSTLLEKAVCFLSFMPSFDLYIATEAWPWAWNISFQEKQGDPTARAGLLPCVWACLSVFWPWRELPFLLTGVHGVALRLSVTPHRGGVGILCLQEERVHADHYPASVLRGVLPVLGGPTPTIEADVVLSLLFGSKSYFTQYLCDSCFLANPMEWADNLGLCSWESGTPSLEMITPVPYSTKTS